MTFRRHPRSLEQAFGPYTSHRIEEKREPLSLVDAIVVWVGVVILAALFASIVLLGA